MRGHAHQGQGRSSVDSLQQRAAATTHVSERSQRRYLVGRWYEFLQDLENDSVDSDLIEEELRALRESAISKREKIVKFLQSNPVQVLLCVIVLLDAGIVIAQILLDLNSVKDKLQVRERQLSDMMQFVRGAHSTSIGDYNGDDVDEVLRLLLLNSDDGLQDSGGDFLGSPKVHVDDELGSGYEPSPPAALASSRSSRPTSPRPVPVARDDDHSTPPLLRLVNRSTSATLSDRGRLDQIGVQAKNSSTVLSSSPSLIGDAEVTTNFIERNKSANRVDEFQGNKHRDIAGLRADQFGSTHDLAHGLHFASIGMLGILVVEVLIKIIAMGKTFCRHKIEIFDAIIIGSSFAIDIVFLGGVSGEEGQKAAAVLVVLLLWRIARVVDGIVVTVKQRQEFRIRLQKRARRAAERKLETFMEDQHAKTKQIEALKDLCLKAGIKDADIAACAPHCVGPVSSTLCALSSVARLSVSMTMLMSSGAHRAARSMNAAVENLPTNGPSPSVSHRSANTRCQQSIEENINGIDLTCAMNTGGKINNIANRSTPSTNKVQHLWKSKRGVMRRPAGVPLRAANVQVGGGGVPPSRIESLPNMCDSGADDDDVEDPIASDPASTDNVNDHQRRRKAGERTRRATGRKFPPYRTISLGNGAVAAVNDVTMTDELSSTSCGDDSSDGNGVTSGTLPTYFDVIREESILRRFKNTEPGTADSTGEVGGSDGSDGGGETPRPLADAETSLHQVVVERSPMSDVSGVTTVNESRNGTSPAVPTGPTMSPVNTTGVRVVIDPGDDFIETVLNGQQL